MNPDKDFTKSGMEQALPENKFPKRDSEPNPARETPEQNSVYDDVEEESDENRPSPAAVYLAIRARKAFEESTNYMDNSLRARWDDNIRMMQNEHPSGSKYFHTSYQGRSKLFRPKIRSAVRHHEAAVAAALFSNSDDLVIKAQDENNPEKSAEARLVQKLVQYRLDKTIPWFLTVLGAWQDTEVYGVCVSRQEWQYEERFDKEYELQIDPVTGEPALDGDGNLLGREVDIPVVEKDRPWVQHIPPERFRFDVNADWRDVVGSSPFLIEQVPMAACDVIAMMDKIDTKTSKPVWYRYDLATVLARGNPSYSAQDSSTQQARAGQRRQAPQDTFSGDEFSTVYVHINIIKESGQDWVQWTLGDSLPLTEPVPIGEVYPHGRPYRVGLSNVEAHRTYPSGTVEMGAPLQDAINDVTNQRRDNVALALNKRYFIKRQKQGSIDLKALMRSVPGGGIMVDDPADVKVIETNDVTGSSYQEQDRMSVEMDELLGNFSQGSVMGNRKLNETVGGMSLMSSGATAVQDLSIRLFIETWVEPVIKDLATLEQMYETDEIILHIAGSQAKLSEAMREAAYEDMLTGADLSVKVNVGMGNTNPNQRIEKLSMALNTLAQFPDLVARFNSDEIGKEVFSFVGYADGNRFLIPEDQVPEQTDPMADVKAQELQLKQMEIDANREVAMAKLEVEREIRMMELALKENLTMAELQLRLELAEQKDRTIRDAAAVREANKSKSDILKFETKGQT